MKILYLKKKDDEKAKPSKQMLITGAAIIAAMIVTIIIIYFLILPGYKKKIVDDVLYGDISDDVVTETTTEVDNAYAAAELKDEISKYVANYFTTTNVEEYLSDENVEQLADLIIKSLKDAGLLEQKDNSDEIRQSIMDQLKELLEQNNLTNEEKYELLKERFEKELKELQEKDTLTEKEFQSVISIINSLKDSTATDFESLKTEIIKQLTNNKELSDEEIAAVKKALEDMAEQNKKDLSDFKKYLEDEVVPGIQQTINENTQNIENNTNAITQNTQDINNNTTSISQNSQDIQNNVTSISNLITSFNGMQTDVSNINNQVSILYDRLNNCSVKYENNHFYATFDEGGADPVTKKLDFAE